MAKQRRKSKRCPECFTRNMILKHQVGSQLLLCGNCKAVLYAIPPRPKPIVEIKLTRQSNDSS